MTLVERLRADQGYKDPGVTDEAADALSAIEVAARPIADFIRKFDLKPIGGLDDEFYRSQAGTEFEASLRLSDLRRLSDALTALEQTEKLQTSDRERKEK